MTREDESIPTGDAVSWNPPDVHPDLDAPHPSVFCTPEEIERARRNAAADGPEWGTQIAEGTVAAADATEWIDLTDDEIRSHVPDSGSYYQFSNISSLCPLDGTKLRAIGWNEPGKATCEEGHVFPNEEHPDEGTGWEAPDGSTHYFRALWNGFVVEDLTHALEPLAIASVLTGEDRYARTVAVALDALSTTYPAAIEGPINFPTTDAGEETGRLTRPGYQVPRTLLRYVSAFDLILSTGAFDRPSPTNSGVSMAENVAINLAVNGADFCERNMQATGYDRLLHNGTADYVRGLLAVGSLLDIDRYVEWATEGRVSIHRMLSNNVDRDGCYYETATMYSEHARRLYLSIAELLYHLEDSHPGGVNLYDDPRFERFYVGARERLGVAGRLPHYGDTGPDPDIDVVPGHFPLEASETTTALVPDHTATSFSDIDSNREIFDQTVRFQDRSTSAETRAEATSRLDALADGDPESELNDAWQLFNVETIRGDAGEHDAGGTDSTDTHTEPAADGSDTETGDDTDSSRSTVLGGPGIAALRPPHGHDRGALLRYGPTLSHGHADELGLNLYAANREMTDDPGYGKAHYRKGWCRQTVAHATAVVDESSQLSTDSPGGSLQQFSTGHGVSVVDVTDEGAYDVDRYRRTLATIDVGPDASYLVDCFRIDGGHVRDYSMHGLGIGFETRNLDLSVPAEGSTLADGSLAGTDCWGEQVRGDGVRRGDGKVPGHEDEGGVWGWEPPGEGYGFLCNPRSASGESAWSATWTDTRDPGARFRMQMLPADDREVIVADGPEPMSYGLSDTENGDYTENDDPGDSKEIDDRVNYVLARETGSVPSQFVSVLEGTGDEFRVEGVEALDTEPTEPDSVEGDFAAERDTEPVALAVDLGDRRDYAASTITGESFAASGTDATAGGDVTIETDGAFAFVRTDGEGIERLRLVGGTHLETDDLAVTGAPASYDGLVREVDAEGPSVLVDATLPAGEALAGDQVVFDAPAYSHNSPYSIERIDHEDDGSRIHLADTSLELSQGAIAAEPHDDVLVNDTFLSLSRNSVHLTAGESNRYFDGKRVVNHDGAATRIRDVEMDAAGLVVESTDGFEAGDELTIFDVAAGDEFSIPVSVSVRRIDSSTIDHPTYVVDAPESVCLGLGESSENVRVYRRTGTDRMAMESPTLDAKTVFGDVNRD